jgi:hypothetical protein
MQVKKFRENHGPPGLNSNLRNAEAAKVTSGGQLRTIDENRTISRADDYGSNFPVSRSGKPFETRSDWAVIYPDPRRQNTFCGVIRLAKSGERFWLHIYELRDCSVGSFEVQLKAKDDRLAKPYRCYLQPSGGHPDQFAGPLQLTGQIYEVVLWRDADNCLRVHFTPEGGCEL